MKTDTKQSTGNVNQSSEKLLALMEFLSEQGEPLRLMDIAAQTAMNSSTALRFLGALQSGGYVTQDIETGRYCLTYKICKIANNVSSRMDMRYIALPYLKAMARRFGCTCNLVVEYDCSVMYLEVMTPPNQMVVPLQRIGGVAPMHCTGAGKLLMSEFSDQRLGELLELRGLTKYTSYTITDRASLEQELETIHQQGYAFDNEECELGTRCIAVPIRDFTRKMVAAVSVNAPTAKMVPDFQKELLDALLETAAKISSHLGYEFGKQKTKNEK